MALEGFQTQGAGTVGIFAIAVAHRHHKAHMGNAVVAFLDLEDLGDLHQVAGTQACKGRAHGDVFRTRQLSLRWQ
jgi:hypothetical protein